MNTKPMVNHCPKCQALLPASAPQGLCPKCLLAAVAMPTGADQLASATTPTLETVAAAFPQLEILELVGSGGMGVVYKARQPRLDRCVALKLLPMSLAADAAFAERFNREARLLARLNHPNIVTVHDFGQSGGFFYLLMEFVDGVNLRQAMEAGRFTPPQALLLVPKICEALQYAHDEGVLHRDIKPSNILLDTRGRVKIADFGIAKLIGDRAQEVTLTASGAAIGTPQYMAPEQLEHPQDVDQRADIYSLGVVFYEMLTGELPIGRFAPPSEKAAVDSRVDEIVFHALEKEREKRFRSAGEVKTSVEAITARGGPDVKARPASTTSVPERHLRCFLSTPEHLLTFTGQAISIYTAKGELHLDAEQLTFVSNWDSVVIPLANIRELGVGHYSRLAKPLRLDYLAVTFDQMGQRRTLLFTPANGNSIIQLPWEANERVAECFRALREAIIARTGTPPAGAAAPVLPSRTFTATLTGALRLGLPFVVLGAGIALVVALLRHPGNASAPQGALPSSMPPQPKASKRGIDADFVLPAHQVAVFEVLTQSNRVVVPVPRLGVYVINGTDEPYAGKFLWANDPEDLDRLTGMPRWKFGIIGPDGSNLNQGLDVPPARANYAGNINLWTALKPDTEVIEGLLHSDPSHPAYGLRIRTRTFKTAPGQNYRSVGQGTNWIKGDASSGTPTTR